MKPTLQILPFILIIDGREWQAHNGNFDEGAAGLNMERMTLEVRVSNKQLSPCTNPGFEEGGIRKKYYSNNLEDALIMWNFHIGDG